MARAKHLATPTYYMLSSRWLGLCGSVRVESTLHVYHWAKIVVAMMFRSTGREKRHIFALVRFPVAQGTTGRLTKSSGASGIPFTGVQLLR